VKSQRGVQGEAHIPVGTILNAVALPGTRGKIENQEGVVRGGTFSRVKKK